MFIPGALWPFSFILHTSANSVQFPLTSLSIKIEDTFRKVSLRGLYPGAMCNELFAALNMSYVGANVVCQVRGNGYLSSGNLEMFSMPFSLGCCFVESLVGWLLVSWGDGAADIGETVVAVPSVVDRNRACWDTARDAHVRHGPVPFQGLAAGGTAARSGHDAVASLSRVVVPTGRWRTLGNRLAVPSKPIKNTIVNVECRNDKRRSLKRWKVAIIINWRQTRPSWMEKPEM